MLKAIAVISVAALLPAAASASGTTYSVVVKRDGFWKTGFGVAGSVPVAPGTVKVDFVNDVSNCAYVATVGNYRARAPFTPGVISATSGGGTSVIVHTNRFNHRRHHLAFQMQVACPDAGAPPAHPSVWAVVSADGSLARGSLVQSVQRNSLGEYLVTFDAFTAHCAPTATRGAAGTGEAAAPGAALAKPWGKNSVGVETTDGLGNRADAGFHLQVSCSDQAGPAFSAVVGAQGALLRGIGASGASHPAQGQYEVDLPQDVSACSFNASLESGGTDPGQNGMIDVSTRAGNPDAILVQTFNLARHPSDRGFHVMVRC